MTLVTLGWLVGVSLFQTLAALPDWRWAWAGLLLPFGFAISPLRCIAAAGCGFFWAWWWALGVLATGVEPAWEGQDVDLTGVVAGVPDVGSRSTRFEFEVETLHWQGEERRGPRRVVLTWYHPAPSVGAGERWRLTARLKRPHGFMNPGGFDYEGWLFAQGIRGTGYVRNAATAERLGLAMGPARVHRVRQALASKLDQVLAGQPLGGAVIGLVVGVTHGMTPAQWDTLAATGTTHLMAISGMHITLVAGMAFFAMRRLWGLVPRFALAFPAPRAAAVVGILTALTYAMLAGFTVPTQRALIMVTILLSGVLAGRGPPGVRTLLVALAAVLAWSPTAVLAPGFWLSFGAVALIGYGMAGRWRARGWWWRWGRLQLLMGLALAPLLVWFFDRVSVLSPLANLVAVPWVELLTVPLALGGTLLLIAVPPLGEGLLRLAEYLLRTLWWILEQLAQGPGSNLSFPGATEAAVGCALVGALILVAPRGLPGRWLGLVWWLPLITAYPPRPQAGEAWLTLLDVGQGLAAVVQTQHHALLYDAGPRWNDGFDAGDAAVLPYLRKAGVDRLDTMIIGHGDSDHLGGAQTVLEHLAVDTLLTSVPERFAGARPQLCLQGASWRWDGVEFEILHPTLPLPATDNDRSCVLRVATAGGAALLPGDIEAAAEMALVRSGARLQAQVLVVPHHGSMTSSSPAFLDAVAPTLALIPAGYRNRFGFPRSEISLRYRERGVTLLNTVEQGAITVRLSATGISEVFSFRPSSRHYWHQRGS